MHVPQRTFGGQLKSFMVEVLEEVLINQKRDKPLMWADLCLIPPELILIPESIPFKPESESESIMV